MASVNPFLSEASHILFRHDRLFMDQWELDAVRDGRVARILTTYMIPIPHVYSIFVRKKVSTWMQVNQECHKHGGTLFTLDSYEQWHILRENVKYVFQEIHRKFWLSSLIYLNPPQLRKV